MFCFLFSDAKIKAKVRPYKKSPIEYFYAVIDEINNSNKVLFLRFASPPNHPNIHNEKKQRIKSRIYTIPDRFMHTNCSNIQKEKLSQLFQSKNTPHGIFSYIRKLSVLFLFIFRRQLSISLFEVF